MSERLHEQGIPCSFFQSIVLLQIGQHQPCTAHTIVEITGKDKAQITRLINELVKIDLIKRQQNPNDKRQFWLSLTPLGFATFTQISDIRQALSQQALNHLTQEEQSLATEVIISMSNNLKSV